MLSISMASRSRYKVILRTLSSLSSNGAQESSAFASSAAAADSSKKILTTFSTTLSESATLQRDYKRGVSNGAYKSKVSLNQETPYNICFVRHGQSTWNRDNRFIGWTDTPLTEEGIIEARVAGQILADSGLRFDEVHTSMLRRCIRTVNLILMELGQEYIPVHKHFRLNERNYGDLVGKNKKEVVRQFGKDQVKRWRRSYDEPPPKMNRDHPYWPGHDPRYHHMLDQIPLSESLHCTMQRSSVYWDECIKPAMREGKCLMIVGHENNLRSLIMRLEGIPKEDIINLNLPRAVPLAYKLDLDTMNPINLRKDNSRDSATGFLRGEWLGGDSAVAQILDRDDKQVYDTTINHNLELGAKDSYKISHQSEKDKSWRAFMGVATSSTGAFQDMGFSSSANVGLECGHYAQEEEKNTRHAA